MLCRYYGLRVISIFEDRTDDRIQIRFERGRPFPLFDGASSRVILAHLPQDQQRRIYLQHAGEIAKLGRGDNWNAFRDRLKAEREAGVVIASDLDKDVVGVAAPIMTGSDTVVGSLVLVRLTKEVNASMTSRLTKLATASALKISDAIQAL